MKKAISLLFLLILTFPSFATCIVVIIGTDFVIIGADSRSTKAHDVATVEKIRKAGNFYIAIAGIGEDTDTKFYPYKIVADILKDKKIYTPIIRDAIKKELTKNLLKELKAIRSNKFFLDLHPNGNAVMLNYAIVGFINNKPFSHTLIFHAPNIKEDKIVVTEDKFRTNTNSVIIIGKGEEATKYMDTHEFEFSKLNPVQSVNKLMEISTQYNTDVGPPIKILGLQQNRFIWLQ